MKHTRYISNHIQKDIYIHTKIFFISLLLNGKHGKIRKNLPTCSTFSTQLLSSSFNPLQKLKLCESDALNEDAL